ncbi:hypothetical protein CCACVL1_25711 [Corchorus capsularis]|uniref:XS domain-containing protein n=1 Tax=Corchorus capsularis TaxID=210143 RepID=A0A1R3GI21_COCAP|nr:hypothetical protein CCACVL1_25711 [Corchorus capsularis]
MAMKRIRKTEEVTEFAYKKFESMSASAYGVDSIIGKFDGVAENRALELDHLLSLSQQYRAEEKRELLHVETNQLKESCGLDAFTQVYPSFSRQGEGVGGFMMNHPQSLKGAFSHGERQQVREDSGHVLPQFYPDLIEKSRGDQMEQENEFLGCRMNCAQNQNGDVIHGDRQKFQPYIHWAEKLQQLEQENLHLGSTMNSHCSHGERKELPEEYGHSLPQNSLDFVRDSQVMEHTKDIFSFKMNRSWPERKPSLNDEKQELNENYVHSLPLHYPHFDVESHQMQQEHGRHVSDFNVDSHQRQQENELLGSRMNLLHKQKGSPVNDEKQQLQDACTHSLPQPHIGLSGESNFMEQENEVLASRVDHPGDAKGAFFNGEGEQLKQDCLCDSYLLTKQGDDVCTTNGCTLQLSGTEELHSNIQSSDIHSKKRIIDLRKIRESGINALPQASNASDHMQELAQPSKSKNIKQRLGPPVHNSKPSNGESKKHGLGSPCRVRSSRKDIKQRLGLPCQLHSPNNMPKIERHNDVHKGVQAPDVDLPYVKRRRTGEDSKEFKQLIHGAFIQFVKVLNENPAQRRKYTEKAKADTLKCCVCGSKSKEFVNMLSLVQHAFTSQTSGLRVKHLGLHKALCVLMGWNSTAASNGLWSQKALPEAEALAIKEDLIIWPPVVILHNSSIAATNSDDRIIVSIEALEAFLADMGFDRGIFKVCRGKPANQSILSVIFHGTFPGLQEAERLHKLYVEKKHGRAEFQRINCSSGGTEKVTVDKVEDVLYGYLGIAGDLDKLDFDTKSRAVIKSKKEIYGVADALLHTK